jgi:hypothetical protein
MMMLTNSTHPSHAVALAVNGSGGAECAGGCRVTARDGCSVAMAGPVSTILPGIRRLMSDGHHVLLRRCGCRVAPSLLDTRRPMPHPAGMIGIAPPAPSTPD